MDSGERLNGIQEVSGSIPLISTIQIREVQKSVETTRFQRFFCFLKSHFYGKTVRLIFAAKILNQAATMEETFKDFLTEYAA